MLFSLQVLPRALAGGDWEAVQLWRPGRLDPGGCGPGGCTLYRTS